GTGAVGVGGLDRHHEGAVGRVFVNIAKGIFGGWGFVDVVDGNCHGGGCAEAGVAAVAHGDGQFVRRQRFEVDGRGVVYGDVAVAVDRKGVARVAGGDRIAQRDVGGRGVGIGRVDRRH